MPDVDPTSVLRGAIEPVAKAHLFRRAQLRQRVTYPDHVGIGRKLPGAAGGGVETTFSGNRFLDHHAARRAAPVRRVRRHLEQAEVGPEQEAAVARSDRAVLKAGRELGVGDAFVGADRE